MLLRTTEIARVGLALFGVLLAGATAVGLSPAGCTREVGQALVGKQARPALFSAVVATAPAWEVARITRVVDGDTYDMLVAGAVVRVRLLGVDCPEHDQPFGSQATDSARAMLQSRVVRVQRVQTDLYGRTLAHLVLPSAPPLRAVRLDSVLVVRGWAWAFDPNHQHAQREAQQLVAQVAGRGLWKCLGRDIEPVPPKVWRGFNAQNKRRYLGSCAW